MFPGIDTWQSQTIALLAPGRKPLTYEGLVAHAELTGAALKELGFLRPQRIAVVLPNGPELATAFVSISTVAGFAPLNPAYSLPEFRFYLEDLQASAVITIPGLSRGERVCAAVVLDGDATEIELKRFARERLAAFKAPARVLIVSEIPKGPTGKMQRGRHGYEARSRVGRIGCAPICGSA